MSTNVTDQRCAVCSYVHPPEGFVEVAGDFDRTAEIHEEALAWQRLRSAIANVVEAVELYPYLWHIGDGCGGRVFDYKTEHYYPSTPKTKKQLPAKTRAIVLARDGLRCVHCGCEDIDELGVDHIIAEANGGPHTLDNLQTLCRPCNSKKGTR